MRLILIPLVLLLAGCATPKENCIKSANKDLAVVDRLIAETQANLTRGYARGRHDPW